MAELIDAIDLRPGMTYLDNGKIYKVLENTFNKTSMAKAVVKCKVKNLRNGSITVEVVSGQKFEKADLNSTVLSFSYVDGTNLVFMDGETYETIEIPETKLADEKKYIFEGSTVKALKYGDEILDIVLPDQVVVELFDAEDAVQGNSVQSAQKKAWFKDAAGGQHELSVPQFIKKGEKIIISTSTGLYVGRSKE